MPVLGGPATGGGSASGFVSKKGVHIPQGWGSEWRTARNNSAFELVESAWFGDSTTAGSTNAGAPYSCLQRIRARLIADGYADGGKGVISGADDTVDYSEPAGEVAGLVSSTWSGGGGSSIIGGGSYNSGSAGQTITFQGYGTQVRIYYLRGVSSADIDITVDGVAQPRLIAYSAGAHRAIECHRIGGLTDGLHTVVLTNVGSGNNGAQAGATNATALVSIHRTTGIVLHKVARGGARFVDFFDPLTEDVGWSTALWRPLTAMGAATQETSTPATAFDGQALGLQLGPAAAPLYPRVRLAVCHLGFNDLSNATSATTAAVVVNRVSTSIAAFCRIARGVGASPLVLSGQLPGNATFRSYGGLITSAIRDSAITHDAAWLDLTVPLGIAWGSNPHLSIAQYRAQGDYIWDQVLSL